MDIKGIKVKEETLNQIGYKESEIVIDKVLADAEMGLNNPMFYAIAGGMSAGKTTLMNILLHESKFPKTAVIYDPDSIMEMLSGYQRDRELLGSAAAFSRWAMPAQELADAIVFYALKEKANIVYTKTFAINKNMSFLGSVINNFAYHAIMHVVDIDEDTAAQRANLREQEIGKPSSQKLIRNYLLRFNRLLPNYIKMLGEWLVYDNGPNESQPRKIVEKYEGQKINILDYEKYSDFVGKVLCPSE